MRRSLAVFIVVSFLTASLAAQEQEFTATIQFPGEKAETVTSFSWGVSPGRTTSGEAGSVGRAVSGELTFTRPVTQLSNVLFLACTSGKHYPSVVLTVAMKKSKDKGQQYYVLTMSDVLVSSYRATGDGASTSDTTSLTYAGVEYLVLP